MNIDSNITTNDFYIRNVANVVHSWMSYLYEVSETKHLAAESSLRYPISGLLERKDDIKLEMEVQHPCFKRKRIDFMWTRKKEPSDGVYLEMKYVRNQSINIQDFFDDIFRLALINENARFKKYFLVCGKTIDFEVHFREILINNQYDDSSLVYTKKEPYKVKQRTISNKEHIFDSVFTFNNDPKKQIPSKKVFNTTDGNISKYYVDFKNRYCELCKEEFQIPLQLKIKTTLLQPIDKGLQSSVAIWEIEGIPIT